MNFYLFFTEEDNTFQSLIGFSYVQILLDVILKLKFLLVIPTIHFHHGDFCLHLFY
jgi:hypothetical protein